MNLSLSRLSAALNFLLVMVLAKEQYLFEFGRIDYKEIINNRWQNKSVKYLQHIDHHLIPSARIIKISTNKIRNLHEGAIKNLPNLQVIRMPYCGIQFISPGAFKNLPQLSIAHLQDNELTIIEENVFNDLPITELWLHRNHIKTIRKGAFDNMPELEVIRLNNNSLSKWDSGWFRNTPKLTELYFRRNLIEELPAEAFVNLRTSHKVNGTELIDLKIYLSSNHISRIDPHAFRGVYTLDHLYLDRNQIRKLDKNTFAHMTQLFELSLKRNKLTKIDVKAFKNLSEMLVLDLSKNDLDCVPYEILSAVKVKVRLEENMLDCDCITNVVDKLKESKASATVLYDECEN